MVTKKARDDGASKPLTIKEVPASLDIFSGSSDLLWVVLELEQHKSVIKTKILNKTSMIFSITRKSSVFSE